jgi:hypothetical protein
MLSVRRLRLESFNYSLSIYMIYELLMTKRLSILRSLSLTFFSTACALLVLAPLAVSAQQPKPTPRPSRQQRTTPEPVAEAQAIKALTVCKEVSPDVVLTVQKSRNGTHYARVESNGTGYNLDDCPYYVVDVTLPGAFRFPAGSYLNEIRIYAGFQGPTLTETDCAAASFSLIIYKRMSSARSPDFTKVADVNPVKAKWKYNGDLTWCDVGYPSITLSEVDLRWPALKVDVPPISDTTARSDSIFRVLVLPKLRGEARPAMVGWRGDDK